MSKMLYDNQEVLGGYLLMENKYREGAEDIALDLLKDNPELVDLCLSERCHWCWQPREYHKPQGKRGTWCWRKRGCIGWRLHRVGGLWPENWQMDYEMVECNGRKVML